MPSVAGIRMATPVMVPSPQHADRGPQHGSEETVEQVVRSERDREAAGEALEDFHHRGSRPEGAAARRITTKLMRRDRHGGRHAEPHPPGHAAKQRRHHDEEQERAQQEAERLEQEHVAEERDQDPGDPGNADGGDLHGRVRLRVAPQQRLAQQAAHRPSMSTQHEGRKPGVEATV